MSCCSPCLPWVSDSLAGCLLLMVSPLFLVQYFVSLPPLFFGTFLPAGLHVHEYSYNIFNEAMAAVLKIMDNNFSAEFHETDAYKALQKIVDEEAEELERLRQVCLPVRVPQSMNRAFLADQ